MIWLSKPDQTKAPEFAPAIEEATGVVPGLPSVAGKPVHVAFDGAQMTSDAGILLLCGGSHCAAARDRRAIGRWHRGPAASRTRARRNGFGIGLARDDRLPRLADRGGLSRWSCPEGNDCDALKCDPAFKMAVGQDGGRARWRSGKMAVGRLPPSGTDWCSQPTISRLENRPGPTALKPVMAARVELLCDSFEQVPRRRARYRRHQRPGARRPATRAVQRRLRQPLLSADPPP